MLLPVPHLYLLYHLDDHAPVADAGAGVGVEADAGVPPVTLTADPPMAVVDLGNHRPQLASKVSSTASHMTVFVAPDAPSKLNFSAADARPITNLAAFIQKRLHR